MLAVIEQVEGGYAARFERHLEHPVEKVWSYLTENEKLSEWFAELSVDDLREGGVYKFDMGDGTFVKSEILELKPNSVLEYVWDEGRVRFELNPESEGCRLHMIETIVKLNDHTPRDLAGWHVCLDVIEALLDSEPLQDRKPRWDSRYREYKALLEKLSLEQW